MKARSWLIPALILMLPLASCHFSRSKGLNRRITLWRKDKIPYGDQIAYDGLSYLFPNATISVNRKAPSYLQSGDRKKAYIIIVPEMDPTPADINAILNFVGEGNHVFISARHFGDSLMHTLSLRGGFKYSLGMEPDSLQLSIYHPVTGDSLSFAYPGDDYDGWVARLDSQYTTILGGITLAGRTWSGSIIRVADRYTCILLRWPSAIFSCSIVITFPIMTSRCRTCRRRCRR